MCVQDNVPLSMPKPGDPNMSVALSLFGGFFIIFLIYGIRKKDPKPIFGVYSVPGKWYYVKYVLFACLYYLRKVSAPLSRYHSFENTSSTDLVLKKRTGSKIMKTYESESHGNPLKDLFYSIS